MPRNSHAVNLGEKHISLDRFSATHSQHLFHGATVSIMWIMRMMLSTMAQDQRIITNQISPGGKVES